MVSGTSSLHNYIFSKGITYGGGGVPAGTGIAMLISGASLNTPVVQVYHAGTMLTSVTPIPNDGSSFNVIYTYNSGSNIGADSKLYVNGVLEDYTASATALGTTDKDLFIGARMDNTYTGIWKFSGSPTGGDASRVAGTYDGGGSGVSPTSTSGAGVIADCKFIITVAAGGVATFEMRATGTGFAVSDTITFDNSTMGGAGTSAVLTITDIGQVRQDQTFNGTLEEIVFYNHILEVPQNAKEFLYNTADKLNVSAAGKLVTNNTRLFLCDYHNIRGKSSKTQTSSNQVSWRATI